MENAAANTWAGRVTTLNCLTATTSWVEALHGHGDMAAVMETFVGLFNCEAALLVRFTPATQTGRCLSKAIAESQKLFPPRAGSPMIHEIASQKFDKVERGTVWQFSDPEDRGMWKPSLKLDQMMDQESVKDVVIIALETKSNAWDFLEFHFATQVAQKTLDVIQLLSHCLAKPWASRLPGLAVRYQMGMRLLQAPDPQTSTHISILDFRNPAGLSRGELRVCNLVKEGLRVQEIADELALQKTTVRSHLHSIFGKTETSGHVELLHRLSLSGAQVGSSVR